MKAGKKEKANKEGKDAIIYVASNALIQFGNLVVIPLFWSKLSPEDYGIIAITEIIGAFLGIFLGLSLEQSINKYYYQWTEEQRKRGIGAIWVVSWSSSIVIGALSIGLFSLVSECIFTNVRFYPYIFLGLIGTVINSLGVITFTTIRIKRIPWIYSIYSLLIFALYLCLRIYYVILIDQGLIGYFKANILVASIIAVVAVIIMSRFAKPCIRGGDLRASLKFSLPMIPSSIISVLTSISDRLILQNFSTLSTLGIYSISLKFASVITALHDGIKLSYGPFLWQIINQEVEAKEIIAKTASVFIIPIVFAGFFISVFIDDILLLINRPQFLPVAEFVPWTVGFTIITCLYLYYSPGMMLGNRTDLLWIPATIQLVTLYICVLIYNNISIFEIIAAKYFAASVYLVTSYYISQKVYYIPHKISRLINILSAYVILLIIFSQIRTYNVYLLFIEKSLLVILFALICCVICVYTKHNIHKKVLSGVQRFMTR